VAAAGSGGTRVAPPGGIVESLQAVAENPDQFALGQTTGEMALESTISLADHLPTTDTGAHKEIALDDEPEVDVLRAVVSAIGSSPLLSELDSDLVRQLIDVGTLVRRSAGEVVFRQGDAGNSLFLILSGEVAVQHELDGETRELARLRGGAFFGEMALITSSPRSATVRAVGAVDLLEVSRRDVRQMIDKNPRVLKLLMRFFRARLVGTLLQTSPIFEAFSRDDRRGLIAAFRLRELGAGHAVFEEGSRAEGLFVLLAGRLEVLRGLDSSIGRLAPGDVFGEMSLLEGGPAMATVKAKTRSWVLLLPVAAFEQLSARHPEMRERLRALAETRKARNAQAEQRVEPV
jgi:CRP-like cAMP-binding protein